MSKNAKKKNRIISTGNELKLMSCSVALVASFALPCLIGIVLSVVHRWRHERARKKYHKRPGDGEGEGGGRK